MKYSSVTQLSWLALVAAIALWGTIGYVVWTISSQGLVYTSGTANEERDLKQQAEALRLQTLVRETKNTRMGLEEIARAEVVGMLDSVESAARDAGIPITIGQAVSAPSSASPVRAATFLVEAEGTFAQIMHAVALLESLPIASSVAEVQLEKLSGSGASDRYSASGPWHVVVRMRFLTTADI